MESNSIFISGSTSIPLPEEGFSKGGHLLNIFASQNLNLSRDPKSRFMIMFDHNERDAREFVKNGGNPSNAVLIRLEPPAVFPTQYSTRVSSLYGKTFTPGEIDLSSGYVDLGWVYRYDANPVMPVLGVKPTGQSFLENDDETLYLNWKNREINLSMVAANKVSPVNSDNYRIRREIAARMDKEEIEIYGTFWNASFAEKARHRLAVAKFALSQKFLPNIVSIYGGLHLRFSTTKGSIEDKHEILKKSKFSIVVENSDTYFSEKLFDALIDGTIPLYIGPSIRKSGLPQAIGVNISGEIEEIRNRIRQLTKLEIIEILKAGREFVNSTNFENYWSESGVYKKIAREIRDFWKI